MRMYWIELVGENWKIYITFVQFMLHICRQVELSEWVSARHTSTQLCRTLHEAIHTDNLVVGYSVYQYIDMPWRAPSACWRATLATQPHTIASETDTRRTHVQFKLHYSVEWYGHQYITIIIIEMYLCRVDRVPGCCRATEDDEEWFDAITRNYYTLDALKLTQWQSRTKQWICDWLRVYMRFTI